MTSKIDQLKDGKFPKIPELLHERSTQQGVASGPWDRNSYDDRLMSYGVATWFVCVSRVCMDLSLDSAHSILLFDRPFPLAAKPSAIESKQCAKFGWRNISVDKLQCDFCGSTLSCDIPVSLTISQVNEKAKTIASSLATNHKPLCPFLESPCPDFFAGFPFRTKEAASGAYESRLKTFESKKELPALSLSSLNLSDGPTRSQLLSCLKVVEGSGKEKGLKQVSTILSICGWEKSCVDMKGNITSEDLAHNSEILHCSLCRRKCGTWNYIDFDGSGLEEEIEMFGDEQERGRDHDLKEESSHKKAKTETSSVSVMRTRKFDPISEHRKYCSFVASDEKGIPGWICTLSSLVDEPCEGLVTSPRVHGAEILASVRRLLKFSTSPTSRLNRAVKKSSVHPVDVGASDAVTLSSAAVEETVDITDNVSAVEHVVENVDANNANNSLEIDDKKMEEEDHDDQQNEEGSDDGHPGAGGRGRRIIRRR